MIITYALSFYMIFGSKERWRDHVPQLLLSMSVPGGLIFSLGLIQNRGFLMDVTQMKTIEFQTSSPLTFGLSVQPNHSVLGMSFIADWLLVTFFPPLVKYSGEFVQHCQVMFGWIEALLIITPLRYFSAIFVVALKALSWNLAVLPKTALINVVTWNGGGIPCATDCSEHHQSRKEGICDKMVILLF